MKPYFLLLLVGWLVAAPARTYAQGKYMTKTGRISFFSANPIEDIEAKNQQVAAVLDLVTGQLAFALPVKGFVFKRTLMQEHFNESYLESDKYPKATFAGRFVGFDAATLATAVFPVATADYKIEIPLLVRDNIAKVVSVRVALVCDALPAVAGTAPRPAK